MSIAREDFLRLLPLAVGGVDFRASGDVFSHQEGDRRWEVHLAARSSLSLGTLVLPRHQVEVRLTGYEPSEAQAFLKRFERHFQRGGG